MWLPTPKHKYTFCHQGDCVHDMGWCGWGVETKKRVSGMLDLCELLLRVSFEERIQARLKKS